MGRTAGRKRGPDGRLLPDPSRYPRWPPGQSPAERHAKAVLRTRAKRIASDTAILLACADRDGIGTRAIKAIPSMLERWVATLSDP